MKSTTKALWMGALLSVMASGAAFAQTTPTTTPPASPAAAPGQPDPGHPRINQVDDRLQKQENKINSAEAAGKITPAQAARDDARDAKVANQLTTDEAKNGGHITKGEQKQLNKEMNNDKKDVKHQERKDAKAPATTPAQ